MQVPSVAGFLLCAAAAGSGGMMPSVSRLLLSVWDVAVFIEADAVYTEGYLN